MKFNALIPELAVSDIAASKAFYRGLMGFAVEYERPEEGFAFMSFGKAQIMLDQLDIGRTFASAPLERPLGRGCSLRIAVAPGRLETRRAST